jgi:hypothetical protein
MFEKKKVILEQSKKNQDSYLEMSSEQWDMTAKLMGGI